MFARTGPDGPGDFNMFPIFSCRNSTMNRSFGLVRLSMSLCVSYKPELWPGMIVRRVAQLTRAQVRLQLWSRTCASKK
jgi:hypothetical protein